MRNLLLAIAAAGMIFSCQSADAQVVTVMPTPVVAQPVIVTAPAYRAQTVRAPRRGNVLQRVVEFEQRKNAWMRRTFLGR
ncbi:MAG: hypothetical protein AAGG48_09175 [Planctomycetota bacterium]